MDIYLERVDEYEQISSIICGYFLFNKVAATPSY